MSDVVLEEEADYGRLQSDIFLSDHNGIRDSREQWERLVWEWESLTLIERYLYQERARSESAPPEVSEEIMHQTAHERNISLVSCTGWQTVWLRTCYNPDLANKYEEMKRESEIPGWGISGNKILDDLSRYDFDNSKDSWRQVLIRVPGITDFYGVWDIDGGGSSDMRYHSGQDGEEIIAQYLEGEEQVGTQYPGLYQGCINIDLSPELTQQHNVTAVPAMFGYKDGEQVKMLVGPRFTDSGAKEFIETVL
ncbi:hypothetical protein FE257_008859 [Aspergillus nanangensis]|uniref:Uncharacterized protein n=1 Tax=Aspergillus nanangensis TaxID=2582783 RepID=A0AAD4CKN7_ASPNN|nr:hypothetical protein FE257_008859 [Aspergillus nanangensis]